MIPGHDLRLRRARIDGCYKVLQIFAKFGVRLGLFSSFQFIFPMERQEVVLSDGDGFQSIQTLFKRIMAVCYIQTVITVIKDSRNTDRLK